MIINKQKTDLVELLANRKTNLAIASAVNSSLEELLLIKQKFINREQFDDEILLTYEQAYWLSKLLEYHSEKCLRTVQVIIDDNYADKKTALDLIDHYERLSKRYMLQAKKLKNNAKKCINILE